MILFIFFELVEKYIKSKKLVSAKSISSQ